ncbi:MAG: DUF3810 domain-containing protein [Blastocatellia bacterium]
MAAFDIFKSLTAGIVVKTVIIIVALVFAVVRFPAHFIERFYSNGIYPLFQTALTPLTNLFPFAVIDVLSIALGVALPAWWITRIARAGRGRLRRTAASLFFHTLVIAAVIFISFQLLWGFNYEREPLVSKLDYDEQRLSVDSLRELTRQTIERLNIEYAEARGGAEPDETVWRRQLHESLNEAVRQLGNRRPIAAAIPKRSLLNFYLAAAGIEGFVSPFGHEVILNREALPFERPFLLAHEWSHLAGFADESEANFVGLLACLQSDAALLRYSGLLALYQYTPALPADEAKQSTPMPRLLPEIREDLKAVSEREARHKSEAVSRAQWAMYDRFLKASGVEAGVASYSQLVRLVLGTRFEDGWTPARH